MAAMVDQRTQAPLTMGYDSMRYTSPQFTDPWASSRNASNALYQSLPQSNPMQQQQSPPRASPMAAGYSSDPMQQARAMYSNAYTSAPQQMSYPPTSNARYATDSYQAPTSYAYDQLRRNSYPVKPPMMGRDSFSDALDASQGMVAMSQTDMTPRAPYARNGSTDSYGFPTNHSHQSSISSASGYPQYYHGSYSGSVDGSVTGSSTDYGSESESAMVSRMSSSGQLGSYHQDQAAMMTQFNSKMSASAQKKHKCKICDKRFTRPSSLQTHMYSHTGEKPFACDFEGCGRHFSVVSNLRRHKKCHKSGNDHPSPDRLSHSSE